MIIFLFGGYNSKGELIYIADDISKETNTNNNNNNVINLQLF